jgi:hypothetical protein
VRGEGRMYSRICPGLGRLSGQQRSAGAAHRNPSWSAPPLAATRALLRVVGGARSGAGCWGGTRRVLLGAGGWLVGGLSAALGCRGPGGIAPYARYRRCRHRPPPGPASTLLFGRAYAAASVQGHAGRRCRATLPLRRRRRRRSSAGGIAAANGHGLAAAMAVAVRCNRRNVCTWSLQPPHWCAAPAIQPPLTHRLPPPPPARSPPRQARPPSPFPPPPPRRRTWRRLVRRRRRVRRRRGRGPEG